MLALLFIVLVWSLSDDAGVDAVECCAEFRVDCDVDCLVLLMTVFFLLKMLLIIMTRMPQLMVSVILWML